jgi:CheY-like chemotaxis protein
MQAHENIFRILLVEDNDADIKLLDILFPQKNNKYHWHVIKDGENAISYLKNPILDQGSLPNLIMLDLNIPRVAGQKIIQTAKSLDAFKAIPIIVLTSSDSEKDIYTSYYYGASCVMIKPSGLQDAKELYGVIEQFWFNTVKLPQRG